MCEGDFSFLLVSFSSLDAAIVSGINGILCTSFRSCVQEYLGL